MRTEDDESRLFHEWFEALNSAGIEAVVCKGFEEAKKFITDRVELNNNGEEL